MRKLLYLFLVLILATVGAYAQFPGGTPNSGAIRTTAKGHFALRDGVLVKFNLKTLQVEGTNELFGPAPKMPEGDFQQNRDAFRAWFADMAKRTAPAIMLPIKDDALVIVVGMAFFRVSQDTLTIEAKNENFATPEAAAPNRGFAPPAVAPAYTLNDNTLFLLEPKELVVLNIKDGSAINTPLPEQMLQKQINIPRGGGGNRPGGGGNRNNNNNGGNPAPNQ